MSPLYLSLSLYLVPLEDGSGIEIDTNEYGLINNQHIEYLPNHVNDHDMQYFLSNLPIQNDGEKLYQMSFLFTPNPAVTGQTHSIIIHVARPTDGSSATATQRTIKYIDSYRVDGIVSGEKISLKDWNVDLKAGDLISLSVPNDAIFLRFGRNAAGLNVPYGLLSVTPGSSDVDRIGLYRISTDASVDGSNPQLCGAFVTYGSTAGGNSGNANANFIFFSQKITAPGKLTAVTFVGFNGAAAKIVVARPSAAAGGQVRQVPELSRDVASFPNGVEVTLSSPIELQANDWVGWTSTSRLSLTSGTMNFYQQSPGQLGYGTASAPMGLYTAQWKARMLLKLPPPPTLPPTEGPGGNRGLGSTNGDPQFAGFQGQSFQFHGLADEHFNLISSPQLQLNSHFVYLSSGNCNYNNTLCFQHPGTYLDVLGLTIPSISGAAGDVRIKLVAGAHADGLRVWMSQSSSDVESEITLGAYSQGLTWLIDADGNKATLKYNTFGEVSITTPMFRIHIVNSDFFFNVGFSLLDHSMLRIGRAKHTINDHNICNHDKHGHAHVDEHDHAEHDHGLVEAQLTKKYHIDMPLHGLIGQTWRNVKVCGKDWMGSVSDYVVSSLFGGDYYYNFYKSTVNSNINVTNA